jgi:hypothetical protein
MDFEVVMDEGTDEMLRAMLGVDVLPESVVQLYGRAMRMVHRVGSGHMAPANLALLAMLADGGEVKCKCASGAPIAVLMPGDKVSGVTSTGQEVRGSVVGRGDDGTVELRRPGRGGNVFVAMETVSIDSGA